MATKKEIISLQAKIRVLLENENVRIAVGPEERSFYSSRIETLDAEQLERIIKNLTPLTDKETANEVKKTQERERKDYGFDIERDMFSLLNGKPHKK